MSGIDTAYIKDEVGPVLAKALADTVVARPEDPVQYLGLRLFHYIQQNEVQEKLREQQESLEREREDWNKVRNTKNALAAQIIQREWKAHQKDTEQHKLREQELLKRLSEGERDLEDAEEYREENIVVEEFEGQTESEKEKEFEKLRARLSYRKAVALVAKLDKSAIGEIKKMRKPSRDVQLVMKACLYLFNRHPKDMRTWMQIRTLIKPSPFLDGANNFDPAAVGAHKRRKFVRARRLLKQVNEENAKSASVAVFVLYQWAQQAVEYRQKRDEDIKMKKEMGRDVEDDEEEEEQEEQEADRDPDEEIERLVEEEEERKRKEEEAALRGDDGEGEANEEEEN